MKNGFVLSILLLSASCVFSQTLEPTETKALINVLVTDDNNVPFEGEIVSFLGKSSKEIFKSHTDKDGKFSILLPIGDTYKIKYRSFTEEVDYSEFAVPAERKLYTMNVKITYQPAKVFVLENVEFDYGKASLRSSSYKALNDLVEVMKLKSRMEIEIGGHTDNIGSDEANLKLSQARAESVKKYLVSKGISASRITAKGYGASMPVDYNTHPDGSDNPEGRQRNRRTEVKITKEHN